MDKVEADLLQVLDQLEDAVRSMGTVHPKPNLLPIFEQLESLAARLPAGTDPTLRHYLQKKSYQKARLYLQGRDAENQAGNCGHS